MRPAAMIPGRLTGPPWRTVLAVAVLVAVNAAVYSRSLTVPFIFDDLTSIPENPNIRQLWPPWRCRCRRRRSWARRAAGRWWA